MQVFTLMCKNVASLATSSLPKVDIPRLNNNNNNEIIIIVIVIVIIIIIIIIIQVYGNECGGK